MCFAWLSDIPGHLRCGNGRNRSWHFAPIVVTGIDSLEGDLDVGQST